MEEGCEGCSHLVFCTHINSNMKCPCKMCIVKSMCKQWCYERHEAGSSTPLSREIFETVSRLTDHGKGIGDKWTDQ